MKTALCILTISALCTVAFAHSDPNGEIHPLIQIEDGNFAIYFETKPATAKDQRSDYWRMVFTPEGKMVNAKQRIEEGQFPTPLRNAFWHQDAAPAAIETSPSGREMRLVLRRGTGNQATHQPLPITLPSDNRVDRTTVANDWAAFTWGTSKTSPGEPLTLMCSLAPLKGKGKGQTIEIGPCACIYFFPRASAPVWAGGRWWIARVCSADPETTSGSISHRWKTVLTSVDPMSGETKHKRLPGVSHWNTTITMQTVSGWLCVAWHAINDETGGGARIETAFEEVPIP